MAVPKQRRSKIARNMRRSHLAKKGLKLTLCPKCREPRLPHTACGNCGTYQGRSVIDVLKKLNRQEQKAKAKAQNSNQ